MLASLALFLLTVNRMSTGEKVFGHQILEDHLAIQQLFTKYTSSVDRKDWRAYREVFTSDALIDYTSAGGRQGTVEDIAVWMEQVFAWFDGVQHSVSNFDLSVDRKTRSGTARVMFDNPFSIRGLPWPRPFARVGGWYVAKLHLISLGDEDTHLAEYHSGAWRIHRLEEEIAYNTVIPSVLGTVLFGSAACYLTIKSLCCTWSRLGDSVLTSSQVGADSFQPGPQLFQGKCCVAEWKSRVELAKAYQIVAKFAQADFGWTHCVYNHITARLDDECCTELGVNGPLFLINPFGARFDEITPGCLHTVDLEGNIVRRGTGLPGVQDRGVLKAGFVIHSAIHSAREDIVAVFHTHHPDVVAVSSLKCGLLPVSLEGTLSLAMLSKTRHKFEGVATEPAERERITAALGPTAQLLILDNHGVIAAGKSVPDALRNLWIFTKACMYQVRALSAAGGDVGRLVLPPPEVVEGCMERELKQQSGPLGEIEFEAWQRGPAC